MQRGKNVAFIALALIFALLASGAVYMYMKDYEKRIIKESGATAPVIGVKVDIAAGTKIRESMLVSLDWPKRKITSEHFIRKDDVIEKVAKTRMVKGMPVLSRMLLQAGDNLSEFVPENMRAMTLYFGKKHAEMSFVTPGSAVDVLATFKKRGQTPFTKTILQNVKVMAVNGKTEGDFDSSKESVVNTITVLVPPEETERLTLAKAQGDLQIVLRNENDKQVVQKQGIDADTMFFGRRETSSSSKKGDEKAVVQQRRSLQIDTPKTVTIIRGTDVQEVRVK